jgi:hypothetical protein
LNLGGGIDVALGRRWDVSAALLHSMWGQNGHAMRTGLSVGIGWSFLTPRARHTHADIASPATPTTHIH